MWKSSSPKDQGFLRPDSLRKVRRPLSIPRKLGYDKYTKTRFCVYLKCDDETICLWSDLYDSRGRRLFKKNQRLKNRTWNRLWWSSISMLRWLRKLHLRNSAICSRNFGRREIEIRVREVQDTWRPNLDDTELLRTTVYQKVRQV